MDWRTERRVLSHSNRAGRFLFAGLLLLGIGSVLSSALADKAEEKPAAKASDAKPTPKPAEKVIAGQGNAVTDGDRLGFDQNKVSSQMNELEERMFRLAESLKQLEPENSSRLRLALKMAREELILQQMKEIQDLLTKFKLDEALTEEKQVVIKLQRLQDLLLSMDLNFQMQLERLRMLRQILRELDVAIKEEDREQKWSNETAKTQDEVRRLTRKLKSLDELIASQTKHRDDGKQLAANVKADAVGKLAGEQKSTKNQTKALAEALKKEGSNGAGLLAAADAMQTAEQQLGAKAMPKAVAAQEDALKKLQDEQSQTAKDLDAQMKKTPNDQFLAMKADQIGNRKKTDNITEMTRKLGESGASAANELVRAAGAMGSAEGELSATRAAPAGEQQQKALESLKYAKNQLEEEAERLLQALHGEVKKRVIEALIAMKEQQQQVRESTQALAPRVKQGSRQALTSVVALAKNEAKIVEMCDDVVNLTEETEFSIALPATLRVIRLQMAAVQGRLQEGDASAPVVAAEKQIEDDLESLLAAMKQMPSTRQSNNKARKGQRDREKELNRLIAELKMVRLLQTRVNFQTSDVDGKRVGQEPSAIQVAVKKAIEAVARRQDEVREAMDKIAETRGNELQQ